MKPTHALCLFLLFWMISPAALAQTADTNITISPETTSVSLGALDSQTVNFTLRNNGAAYRCVFLYLEGTSSVITGELSTGQVCLNPGASGQFFVDVGSRNASTNTYSMLVRVQGDNFALNRSARIEIRVDNSSPGPENNIAQQVIVYPTTQTVNLSATDSARLTTRIANNSQANLCFRVLKNGVSSKVRLDLDSDRFCLNAGSSFVLNYTVETVNADTGNRPLQIRFIDDSTSSGVDKALDLTVQVGPPSAVEISVPALNVCRGNENTAQVRFRNKTVDPVTLQVWAESQALLPAFEAATVTLGPLEEQFVTLDFFTGSTTAPGLYPLTVYASTDREFVKREATIGVSDCSGQSQPNFRLIADSSSCRVVTAGTEGTVRVEVANLLPSEVPVYLDAFGDIDVRTEPASFTLEPLRSRSVSVFTKVSPFVSAGDYRFTLLAYNENFKVEREFCVRLAGGSDSSITLSPDLLPVVRGGSASAVLRVHNGANASQSYRVRVGPTVPDLDIVVSTPAFSLGRGETRDVFLTVNARSTTPLDIFDINLTVDYNNGLVKRPFFVRVVSATPGPEASGPLTVSSFPHVVRIPSTGDSTVLVGVTNLSTAPFSNVRVSLEGLLPSFASTSATIPSLFPTATQSVSLRVQSENAPAGRYPVRLMVVADGVSRTENVEFIVESDSTTSPIGNNNNGSDGLFAGLFGLGSGLFSGLSLLLLIVLAVWILVLILRAVVPPASAPRGWMRRN